MQTLDDDRVVLVQAAAHDTQPFDLRTEFNGAVGGLVVAIHHQHELLAEVGTDLGKKFVLVMDGDNKTAYRAVELGPKIEGLRIVRSGLNKDDTIVVKGLQRVRPGSPVSPEVIPMASEQTIAALAQQRQALEASNLPKVAPAKGAPGSVVKLAAATPRG